MIVETLAGTKNTGHTSQVQVDHCSTDIKIRIIRGFPLRLTLYSIAQRHLKFCLFPVAR